MRGLAQPVTDDRAWLAAYRALIASFGLVGRLAVRDIEGLSDAKLLARYRSLPIVRIVPIGAGSALEPGRWDEGWSGAVAQTGLVLFAAVLLGGVRRVWHWASG